MKIDAFRVQEGENAGLAKRPTAIAPLYTSHTHYRTLINARIDELTLQQGLLYANHRHSLLLIFQALDAAGKDNAIKHVMSGVNPQGCKVFSFKHPSSAELAHDFLWRTNECLPERGQITIFNRSYYEEVLIVRVQPEILLSEGVPTGARDAGFWQQRYRSIANLESHLHRSGTRIIKFFLHLSKEEQRQRFLRRIDDPDKNWKLSLADLEQRRFWAQYQEAYEACLSATSTNDCPWYVVPADDKQNAHVIISEIVVEALGRLRMAWPKADPARRRELQAIRKRLGR